jgi:hypothetical protein
MAMIKICGHKTEELKGKWRKLYAEILVFALHRQIFGYQIKKKEMDGACGTYGGEVKNIEGLKEKHERKGPDGRRMRKSVANINHK